MRLVRPIFFLLIFCFASFGIDAQSDRSIKAIALFNAKAMLSIDGDAGKIIAEGQSYKNVLLVKATTDLAVIEVDGKRRTLKLNGTHVISSNSASLGSDANRTVTLYEDASGFFKTNGYVGGSSTPFLVDTGANLLVFNSLQARRLNIDYRKGQLGYASTASGRAPMYAVTLDEVAVGGIRLRSVAAGVIEGNFPEIPLLGMSFLGRLEMTKKGKVLTLEK